MKTMWNSLILEGKFFIVVCSLASFSSIIADTTCLVDYSLPFIETFEDSSDCDWKKPEGSADWNRDSGVYTRGTSTMGSDGHYISYVGDETWGNYVVSADVRTMSSSNGWAVLVFRVRDSANYHSFQIEPSGNNFSLERRENFVYTSLANEMTVGKSVPLSAGTWHNVEVRLVDDSAFCFIDSELVITYQGLDLLTGGAGLASWHMSSQFDNFSVTPLPSSDTCGNPSYTLPFDDDFEDGDDCWWRKSEGPADWHVESGVYKRGRSTENDDGHFVSLVGDDTWADYTCSVKAQTVTESHGWAVLIFRAQDEANYYTLQIEPATNSASLERRTNYQYTVLSQSFGLELRDQTWYELKVSVEGDSVWCYIDNSLIFAYGDLSIPAGAAGLASWHCASEFNDFVVSETLFENHELHCGMQTHFGQPGDDIWVPFHIVNHDEYEIHSCQFTLHYDTSVVTFITYSMDSSIVSDWMVDANSNAADSVTIAMAGTQSPINYGNGELVRFHFRINTSVSQGDSTDCILTDLILDENPENLIASISNGKIIIEEDAVVYGDVTGNGDVTVIDAEKILHYVVGNLTLPDPAVPNFSDEIADVSANGTITSYDAALVLHYCIGLIPEFPVHRTLRGLSRIRMMSAREITSAAVSLETLRHDASYKITIKGTNICGFVSGDFSLEYDTEKVNTSLLSYGDITTPLRDAFLFSKSNASRNMLTIALSTENDIDEAGDVTFITLTLPHEAIRDESAPFVLRKALLNEGKIPTTIIEETVPVQSQFHTKFDSRLQRYMLQRNRFGSVSAKVSLFDLRGKRRRVPFGKQSNSVDASESFSSGIIIVYDRNDDSKALIPLINAK